MKMYIIKQLLFSVLLLVPVSLSAKSSTPELPDFAVENIGRTVRDIEPRFIENPSSPLDYYRTRAWVRLNGKTGLWHDISSKRFDFDRNAPDETVDSATKEYVLNEPIVKIISYRDSAAAVVTRNSETLYLINYTWIEDGRWVNGGQGLGGSLDEAEEIIFENLPLQLSNIPRINSIAAVPTDETPFSDFIAGISQSPEEFMLASLKAHKLVINGEYHRRKVSWDALKRLIGLPDFPETVGTVFMELPSWRQSTMDAFMSSDSIDSEKIYTIFRDEQPNGWWDRGEYEFLCDLWNINHNLPDDRKIKVVLADYQIPYSTITSKEDAREKEERNTHMANIIEDYINSSVDNRHSLFLVGCAHAYKSHSPALQAGKEGLTAGAQLARRLGNDNVFVIFQHTVSGDNMGRNKKPLRGGIFDKAFALQGNRPIGFSLKGSPFGKEPFDGISEIKYDCRTGSYEDNYDGYLFLHSINDEPQNTALTEIFTPSFIEEMKRRAAILGFERFRGMWFGVTAPEMTQEIVVRDLSE